MHMIVHKHLSQKMVPAVRRIKTLGYASIYIYIHFKQKPQTLQRLKTPDKGVTLKKRSQERTASKSVPTVLKGWWNKPMHLSD